MLTAGSAHANGRFPAASQVVFDPGDPRHFILLATFGLIETWDGGKTFSWTCEIALGLSGTVDPGVVITESGTSVVANNSTGVIRSVDRCSYAGGTESSDKLTIAGLVEPASHRFGHDPSDLACALELLD